MIKPNYKDGSIVNLMSTILKSYGVKSNYAPLKGLELDKSKSVVLVVIDGFGYEYLMNNKENTVFEDYEIKKMTSVFPATTAAGITSFFTGQAPSQHAMTGWYMFLKEAGGIYTGLRSVPKLGGKMFSQLGIDPREVYNYKSVFEKIKIDKYMVIDKEIITSDYNVNINKNVKFLFCKSLTSFFNKIKRAIKTKKENRKFIYAYWPLFDKYFHHYGEKSRELTKHFNQIQRKFKSFLKSVKKTDSTIIITSDHGLVDVKKTIHMVDHPKLQETLTLSLCGDGRLAYCYVKPFKTKEFERYVMTKMSKYCTLIKSSELVKKGFYGPPPYNKKLFDRIGDYVLILKEGYAIRDRLVGQEKKSKKGAHGGASKKEMYVPLIVINNSSK